MENVRNIFVREINRVLSFNAFDPYEEEEEEEEVEIPEAKISNVIGLNLTFTSLLLSSNDLKT